MLRVLEPCWWKKDVSIHVTPHAVQGILGHFHRPAVVLWGLGFQSLLELYKEEIACVVGLFFPHIIMSVPNNPLLNYGDGAFQLDETQSSASSSCVQLAATADLKPHKYLCGGGEHEAGVSSPSQVGRVESPGVSLVDTALRAVQGELILVSWDSWLGREAGASGKLINTAQCVEMNRGLHLW